MRQFTLSILIFLIFFSAYSQSVDETRNFIIDNSGVVTYGDSVDVHLKGRNPYVKLDSTQMNIYKVKYYKNGDDYYARFNGFVGGDTFGERVKRGEVNLYAQTRTVITYRTERRPSQFTNTGNASMQNPYGTSYTTIKTPKKTKQERLMYSVEYGDLYDLTYRNLKRDFGDHSAAIPYLRKIQSQRVLTPVLCTTGVAVLVGGFVYSVGKLVNDSDADIGGTFVATSLTGMAIFGSGMVVRIPIHKNMTRMIDAVNNYDY